jgi:hypothetical protein
MFINSNPTQSEQNFTHPHCSGVAPFRVYPRKTHSKPYDTEKPIRAVMIPIKHAQKQQECCRRYPYLGFLFRCYSDPYGYAAQHLVKCEGLACRIEDYGTFEPHVAYVARLRRDHGRKTGFWGHST